MSDIVFMQKKLQLHNLTIINLVYLIFVIIFGSFVRATGYGAGCGSSWPLCNGEIVPHAPHLKTLIEFSHRLTSAGLVILVVTIALFCYQSKNSALKKIINYYSPYDYVLKAAHDEKWVESPIGYKGALGTTTSKYNQKQVRPQNHRFTSYAKTIISFP